MTKLSAADIAELTKLRDEHRETVDEFRAVVEEIEARYEAAYDEYQTSLQALADFRDAVTAKMEEYAEAKSERWQEGEAGQAYEEWRAAWADLDFTGSEAELDFSAWEVVEDPFEDIALMVERTPVA